VVLFSGKTTSVSRPLLRQIQDMISDKSDLLLNITKYLHVSLFRETLVSIYSYWSASYMLLLPLRNQSFYVHDNNRLTKSLSLIRMIMHNHPRESENYCEVRLNNALSMLIKSEKELV
jgi:hypothetical protein